MKREQHLWSLPEPGEKEYWRSLDQISKTPAFQEFVSREFPEGAAELKHPVSRRSFMHLMGASMAMAGLVGCRRPLEKIVPFVKQPESMTLGVSRHYGTTITFGQEALGLIVESHEGRPTKIEGNPKHPASLGSTNAFAQASLWELYDPDRSQKFKWEGHPADESLLASKLAELHHEWLAKKGEGLHILSGALLSPALIAAREALIQKMPKAAWHTWEPWNDDNQREATRITMGGDMHPFLHLEKARIIVALDADPLGLDADAIRNARSFSLHRRPTADQSAMNRLYAIEPSWTLTGTMADHRLRVRPSELGVALCHLIAWLKQKGLSLDLPADYTENLPAFSSNGLQFVAALGQDLMDHRHEGVVLVAGLRQPKEIHVLTHVVNQALGAIGRTLSYKSKPDAGKKTDREAIATLANLLDLGQVHTLVCLGTNPVYNAPADLNFETKIKKASHVIHLGLYQDETQQVSSMHIPQSHYLESWGDAIATDGTYSIVQPLIAPLYTTWSDLELVSCLIDGKKASGYELVRKKQFSLSNDALSSNVASLESCWKKTLQQGVHAAMAVVGFCPPSPSEKVAGTEAWRNPSLDLMGSRKSGQHTGYEILFAPDYSVYDGRFSNNGWLQEFPDPITKMVWDNAAIISDSTAKSLGIKENELLRINVRGREIELVAHIQPGQAEKTITLPMGYGRISTLGRIAAGAGFNVYPLRHGHALGFDVATEVKRTGKTYQDPRDMKDIVDISKITGLVSTQDHFSLEGRPIFREADLNTFKKEPTFAKKEPTDTHNSAKNKYYLNVMWERPAEFEKGQQWGMAIDLSSCTGCGACTIACQVENNIPIVGKPQVRKGREMHWIRIDRYFEGSAEDPHAVHQPVTCMHCENAPCENVCPVAATAHSPDGLNDMAYNRCIGTRYCSNNCPYKVRRFNFLDWRGESGEENNEVASLKYNPDVTVRSRGIMEKCTYCVQRIRGAQKEAKLAGHATVEDGKIAPACAQACPTQAIVFGDINNAKSKVSELKRDARNYAMLAELNTQPRTTYLAAVRNPNPALSSTKDAASSKGEHHG